jgi:hypothetical protein
MLKFPRDVAGHDSASVIEQTLQAAHGELYPGSDYQVPTLALNDGIQAALTTAGLEGQLVRGLESASRRLRDEKQGLAQADARSGQTRASRMSRLLIVAGDGSKRFYRDIEPLLKHHGERLGVVRFDVDQTTLGGAIYGGESMAKAVLLTHKAALTQFLLAVAPDDSAEDTRTPGGATSEPATPDHATLEQVPPDSTDVGSTSD